MVASEHPIAVSQLDELQTLFAQWTGLGQAATLAEREAIVTRMITIIASDSSLVALLNGPDDAALLKQSIEADAQYVLAQAAHDELRARLQAKGTTTALRMVSGICFASGNGTVRHQGGGTINAARRESEAAWRYAEAQNIRWNAAAEAQKAAYLLLPEIPAWVLTATPTEWERRRGEDPLVRILSEADFMRLLREAYADVVHLPDRPLRRRRAGQCHRVECGHARREAGPTTGSRHCHRVSLPQCNDCRSWFVEQASRPARRSWSGTLRRRASSCRRATSRRSPTCWSDPSTPTFSWLGP